MIKTYTFADHNEWLQGRQAQIGGSEAAAVIGLNPYMTNVDLWELKTGRRQAEDISDKPYIIYGTKAEEHLRELFALDFPQYEVTHNDHAFYVNDQYPFAHASLDGELLEIETGRRGILEIKTTTISRAGQSEKWNGKIPDNYYCQLLHYFAATGYTFAVLKAQIKYEIGDDVKLITKHYKIERDEVQDDIDLLMESESRFWQHVQENKKPDLILPQI